MLPVGRRNPGSGFGGPRYPGTFLLALREALGAINWEPATWKGASVECVDAQGKQQEIGLENMYRRLRHEPRENWPKLIADLLGSVPPDVANPPADLHEVADRILVRLGAPMPRKHDATDVWTVPIVEGHLAASLVIDYPTSMSYVSEKMIADSDQDGEYWYERALANLRGKSDAGGFAQVHDESGILQAQVGDAYDSSRGLLLDLLLPGHEENGFYVVVPGRDHLLVLPIAADTMMLGPWLRAVAAKMYHDLPYPISPELFWVRDGAWHLFAIEAVGDDLVAKPPLEFEDVMKRLRPDDFGDQDDPEPPSEAGDSMPI